MKSYLIIFTAIIFSVVSSGSVYSISTEDLEAIYENTIYYEEGARGCTTFVDNVQDAEQRRRAAFEYFAITRGLTNEQSAGIVGNLMYETINTMDPTIEQGRRNDGFDSQVAIGYGLAQWTSTGRKERLEEFGVVTNRPIGGDLLQEFLMQLDFIWYEMTEEYYDPSGNLVELDIWGGESGSFDALIETETVYDAAKTFSQRYERNSAAIDYGNGLISEQEAFGERASRAQDVYDAYVGGADNFQATAGTCDIAPTIIGGDTSDFPCDPRAIRDYVADGYRENVLIKIRVCVMPDAQGNVGPHVNSQISTSVMELLLAAYADGVFLTGGGFRSMAGQIAARENNNCPDIYDAPANQCEPPTARPGYSNHQMGFAIDFKYGNSIDDAALIRCRGNRRPDACRETNENPGFNWLDTYANQFGLQVLSSEAWHWSIDGH